MASDHESHGEDISADNVTPAADAVPEVAPVKKATRRRATRPAKTAAPAAPAAPAVETVDVASALAEIQLPPAQDELSEAEPAAEAAPRRRARKRTAPRAAPRAAAADVAEPTEAGPGSSPETGGTEPEQEAPAAPVKAAKRTRRKAVSPAQAPATADPAADTAGVDTAVVDISALDVTVDAAAVDTVPVAEPVPAVDPLDDDEAAAAPVVPMPLFQAPEPVRRPRRAASRPAGPPKHAVGEDAPADAAELTSAAPVDEQPGGLPIEEDAEESEAIVAPGLGDLSDDSGDVSADLEATDEATDEDEQDAEDGDQPRRRRRRGGRGRRGRTRAEGDEPGDGTAESAAPSQPAESVGSVQSAEAAESAEGELPAEDEESEEAGESSGSRRRRRRRRRGSSSGEAESTEDPPNTVTRVRETRETRERSGSSRDEATGIKGSTRLEAKKQRRREGREVGRRRQVISEAEFLARRESVERVMVVRENDGRTQIGVLEDGVLVEHYVARKTQTSMVGNVYLGRVQNVLPSMEAAFIDIGKGRNAVLYAGEVNWDQAGLDGQPRRIENALKAGEPVLVQVTKDPIGHKGARLTSQISMPGRYLVYVPEGSMTGISRKLPENERARLKKVLKAVVPDHAGVIVRTAAEGASDVELERDVARLQAQWDDIDKKVAGGNAPTMLYSEPDLAIRVVRDIFNEDFSSLIISGDDAWDTLQGYIGHVAPDLVERVSRWDGQGDVFAAKRIDEQLHKAMDRKVWLPSGGSLVIDRTEAMTVVDVNTGKFTGSGGSNLEETVTKNNLEAVEEVVRQLRLRDIGGIIVVDFIDMVLESNRDLVLRRLLECLGRDRTRHQVAEVTSLGLVQMTRKRVGQGLVEVFSETCEHCGGRGIIVHDEPVEKKQDNGGGNGRRGKN